MKVGLLSLMLAAAGIVIPVAAQAVAEHYQLDIPRQQLDAALKDLAQQTGLQIARFSDTPGGSAFVGPLRGDMPVIDALKTLLAPSKLTYKIVNDHTIAVMTLSAAAAQTESAVRSGISQSASPAAGDSKQEGKKSFWDNFRLAQANQGVAQSSSTVGSDAQSVSGSSVNSPQLTEILVTAQKKSERLQDVPIPVSVLNTEALTMNNQVLLRDYYSSVPGLSVSPDINGAQILTIRGITTGGIATPTVGVTVDDVPFGASGGRGDGSFVPDFDPGDLARIEVLRGPQGTLYGANSMGGLVKYVTVDPSPEGYGGRVEAGTNSVANGAEPGFNIRGSVNLPLSDTFAIRMSGFRRQDPGYIDNPSLGQQGVNEGEASGARLSALWRPSDAVSLKLSALYQNNDANGLSEINKGPDLRNLQQDYVAGVRGADRTLEAYSATLNAKVGNIDLTSVTGYNINRELSSFDFTPFFGALTAGGIPGTGFAGFGPGITGSPMHFRTDYSKVTQEFRVSSSFWQHFDWVAGAFYTHEDDINSEVVYGSNPTTGQIFGQTWFDYYPDKFQEYAAFANLTYHISDRLDVQIGGRESQIKVSESGVATGPFNIIFFHTLGTYVQPEEVEKNNAFTYVLTPSFKVSPDLMVYARLASGYRPGAPNANLPGIPSQKPDKTENYELGIKSDFLNHMLSVDASLYYIDWKDIQLSLTTANSVAYGFNGSAAKSEGVELSVEARPLTDLTITAWVAYDDAALTQAFPANSTAYGVPGYRLPDTPRFSSSVSLEQDFPLWSNATGFVGAAASYVGDRTGYFTATPQRQNLPSYTKTDLRAGVKSNSWTTSIYANNVADARGLLNGGLGYIQPNAFIYITPRTIGVSVSKAF